MSDSAPPSAGENGFTILCVCTGNVCRSPAAERLLAARLGSEVRVSSAGTQALVHHPISPPMDILIAEAGGDPGGFAARRLTEQLIAPADLVVAMTTAHRGDVVELWPRAVRRTFTLKELARLLAVVDRTALPATGVAARLRAALPLAAAQRRAVGAPGADDVPDPYRRGADAYAAAFVQIEAAVAVVAEVLAPQRAPDRRTP